MGGILLFARCQSWQKDNALINLNSRGQRSRWQEEGVTDKKRWKPRWTGVGGATRGGGGDTATSQADDKGTGGGTGRREAAV